MEDEKENEVSHRDYQIYDEDSTIKHSFTKISHMSLK